MRTATKSLDLISTNKIARAAQFFVKSFAAVWHDYNAVLHEKNVKLPSYTLFCLWRNCRMCSPKILLLVFFLFAFIFRTVTDFHLAGRKYFSFSHRHYEIFMLFFPKKFVSFVFHLSL